VYPNPAHDVLNIEFDKQFQKQNMRITLFDGVGKKVLQPKPVVHTLYTKLDISTLPKGVYFVEIQGSQKHIVKFVKD
jgi:hypothetical protein